MERNARKRVGRPRRKKYPAKINVGFSEKTMGQIERLSDTYDLNLADVIRDAVDTGTSTHFGTAQKKDTTAEIQ